MANSMSPLKRLTIVLVFGAVAFIAIYLLIVMTWSFSTGERAGYIQKISRKGWICKTWEGEMVLIGVPGSPLEKFYFSTRDEKIAHEISSLVGTKAIIAYEQKKGIPTTCFGDTDYRPVAVKKAP